MNDLLPQDSPVWQFLEQCVSDVLASYGYNEIRFPILEETDLFKRSIGEVTDIVEKEMYTFESRSGKSLTLRPEGTAGCVRAAVQNGLLNQIQRLWYMGPMFRYERPQKGRLRQFHQIGVEVFGAPGADIDAELIALSANIWHRLGLSEHVTLQLNSIGSMAEREQYKLALVEFLQDRAEQLDEDSQRRLSSNPLRILDSKSTQTQEVLNDAPALFDYLGQESIDHFNDLKLLLEAAGIEYEVNNRLVRGLDYYGKTVFEWVTNQLGAQGTVCAGGRYDGLVEQLGGRSTPAVGFAMGIERLTLLLQATASVPAAIRDRIDVYQVIVGDAPVRHRAMEVGEKIRQALPQLRMLNHSGTGNFKNQMKKADKSGAHIALIIGEDEFNKNEISIKYLRSDAKEAALGLQSAQRSLSLADLISELEGFLEQ